MPISYLSKVYESNPYVVPLDLGLLAKVNQYKQSEFYQGAEKLNTQFQQLDNLDILKDDERNYTKDKVNNLLTQVNSMGAMDYSDANVNNTLSNYANGIYNDKVVSTAITSTKAVRTYLKNADTIKNDPKLNKYYDPAREWYDTQYAENPNSIANYKKSKMGEAYSGPTAPTPSLGSDWDILTKEIQKIHPEITERFDQSGNRFFIDKTTNTKVDQETIRRMVDGKIDGKVADQLNVHAAYNYYGLTGGTYTKEQGIAEYNQNNVNNYKRISDGIDSLQQQITLEPDNEKRLLLEKTLQDNSGYLVDAQKAVDRGAKDFSDLWDKNGKSAAFYNLYTNKLKDDIGKVYSYTDTKHQLIVNQEALANARIDLEAMKEDAKVIRNADGTVSLKKKTGKDAIPPDPAMTALERDYSTEADLNATKTTQESLQNDINAAQNNLNSDLLSVVHETANLANIPGLVDKTKSSINNDPNANPISHPDILRKVAQLTGDEKLTKEDFDRVLTDVKKYGSFDANGEYSFSKESLAKGSVVKITHNNTTVELTPQQVTFFKNVRDILDKGADGADISGKITNVGAWRNYLNKFSIEQNTIIHNRNLLQTAKDQVLQPLYTKAGLSQKEIEAVNQYTVNPNLYRKETTFNNLVNIDGKNIPIKGYQNSNMTPAMEQGLHKLGAIGANVNKLQSAVDDVLGRTDNRKNYYSILLPDRTKDLEDEHGQIKNYILSSGTTDAVGIKKSEDIHPIGVVTDGTDYFIKYTNNSDVTKGRGYAKITPENLREMGVAPVPYPSLERVVSENGELPTPIYIDPQATGNKFNYDNGFTAPIKIQLVNMNISGGDRNNDNITPAIVYQGKNYFYKAGNAKSANVALGNIQQLIYNNTQFTSIKDIIDALEQDNNK